MYDEEVGMKIIRIMNGGRVLLVSVNGKISLVIIKKQAR